MDLLVHFRFDSNINTLFLYQLFRLGRKNGSRSSKINGKKHEFENNLSIFSKETCKKKSEDNFIANTKVHKSSQVIGGLLCLR
jgi:hypothetical protein